MKKLDQKQIPQFVALCILSSGVFGYFVVRMVTPSPAAASTAAHPPAAPATAAAPAAAAATAAPARAAASATNTPTATPAAVGTATATATDSVPLVIPPSPGMRDPFVIGYVDPKTAANPATPQPTAAAPVQEARATVPGLSTFPAPVAPLPSLTDLTVRPTRFTSSLPAIQTPPAAPAPPSWLVTGVLQTDTDKMAILRNGDARRIVRSGDFVDSVYRVTDVTRSCVVLRHGTFTYRLLLGGDKPAASPALPPASFSAPPAFTAPPASVAPPMFTPPPTSPAPPSQRAPSRRPGVPDAAALSQAGRSLHRLAQLWLRASPALPVHARTARPAEQLALRFLGGEDAETRLGR